jgi:spore maturation protein CgeB
MCRALGKRGHRVLFFEKDVPYYASTRDMTDIPGCELRLYDVWDDVARHAAKELADADVGMVTSFCPDGPEACRLVLESAARIHSFYDLDTPVTLSRLEAGERVPYLPATGLADFDVVLSYTGGVALRRLATLLKAPRVAPLYGSVDPVIHQPAEAMPEFTADLSYLGTYAADRQDALEELLLEPARLAGSKRFVIGGAQYPADFPWSSNIYFVRHLPPALHPAFYCSSRMTLNITRRAMADMGFCPSGRLFEAAACGTPILSDVWEGLAEFYEPGKEILLCRNRDDVLGALEMSDSELKKIAAAARERTLAEHTAEHRVLELENILEGTHVGNHSGSGEGKPHTAAGLFEGTAAGGQPI